MSDDVKADKAKSAFLKAKQLLKAKKAAAAEKAAAEAQNNENVAEVVPGDILLSRVSEAVRLLPELSLTSICLSSLITESISLKLSSILSQNSTGVCTRFRESRNALNSPLSKLSLSGESLRDTGVSPTETCAELDDSPLSASDVTDSV